VAISQIEEDLRLDRPVRNWRKCWNRWRREKASSGKDRGDICSRPTGAHPRRFRGGAGDYREGAGSGQGGSRVRAAYRLWCSSGGRRGWQRRGKLLDSARSEIGSRHFTAAMKLLSDVEQIDPSNPELISLLKQAKVRTGTRAARRVVEQMRTKSGGYAPTNSYHSSAGII